MSELLSSKDRDKVCAAKFPAERLGDLTPVLDLPSWLMSVVYLPDRYRAPKVRSFVDFMVARFGEDS